MTKLSAKDFPAFFQAVHQVHPFPWQLKLAQQVVEGGKWPSLLDLPTGVGKTASIDIAVFHLACEAAQGSARKAALRTLFVVDRRIVVDAAFDRARKIAEALKRAQSGTLKAVADRLRCFVGTDSPALQVTRLRGGMPQDQDWARSPVQPLVVISTVDQVGSRLLFRGYGVTPRMWPVHAGLVGSDTLWLLDEVHLSTPLNETLDAIVTGHSSQGGGGMATTQRLAPFAVVKLSATPDEGHANAFPLSDEDREHSVLKARLTAHKRARIEPWNEGKAAEAFSRAAARLAGLIEEPSKTQKRKKKGPREPTGSPIPVHRVAVVVNRVGFARQVFEKLKKELGVKARILLLTGRIRPLDRNQIMMDLEPLLVAPNREQPARPIILVATQTIEVGADLDVDALVTEIAPLDSLRQRFGRLDRLGTRGESRAVILHPSGKKPKKDERNDWTPIFWLYGESAYNMKEWLGRQHPEIDFGIDALAPKLESLVERQEVDKLLAPRVHAPVLLPAYAELWATTSPPSAATPEPALFLHGPGKPADVQVVWRADIDLNDNDIERTRRSLDYCPPSSLEAMPVPLWAICGWLQSQKNAEDMADIPHPAPNPRAGGQVTTGRPCLRRENTGWSKVSARDLKPGDVIVVPCSYGGSDLWGWDPYNDGEVADIGTEAHYYHRLKGSIRVTRQTLMNALDRRADADRTVEVDEMWRRISRQIEEYGNTLDAETMRTSLVEIHGVPENWKSLLREMKGAGVEIEFYDDDDHTQGFVLYAKRTLQPGLSLERLEQQDGAELQNESGNDAVTERDDSWATGVQVELIAHLGHVEAKARAFAQRAGLDERMTNLLALAGKMHDLGKADQRFQANLHGTSALAHLGLLGAPDTLLAKSFRAPQQRYRKRATPRNFRHEALSVALARQYSVITQLNKEDRDLVLWLVGTHHGYGRPFFPPCEDSTNDASNKVRVSVEIEGQALTAKPSDAPLRLDQGWFERAARLLQRFGPWELARLEAILRLADHAASADEQQNPFQSSRDIP